MQTKLKGLEAPCDIYGIMSGLSTFSGLASSPYDAIIEYILLST